MCWWSMNWLECANEGSRREDSRRVSGRLKYHTMICKVQVFCWSRWREEWTQITELTLTKWLTPSAQLRQSWWLDVSQGVFYFLWIGGVQSSTIFWTLATARESLYSQGVFYFFWLRGVQSSTLSLTLATAGENLKLFYTNFSLMFE